MAPMKMYHPLSRLALYSVLLLVAMMLHLLMFGAPVIAISALSCCTTCYKYVHTPVFEDNDGNAYLFSMIKTSFLLEVVPGFNKGDGMEVVVIG